MNRLAIVAIALILLGTKSIIDCQTTEDPTTTTTTTITTTTVTTTTITTTTTSSSLDCIFYNIYLTEKIIFFKLIFQSFFSLLYCECYLQGVFARYQLLFLQ